MRISEHKINKILKNQIIKTFAQTLTDFNKVEQVEMFLQDFFNDSELETFAKRLAVSYWLRKKRSYVNIKENLKVSSATIASIQDTLERPGMKLALKDMEAEEWANVWSEKIKKFINHKNV
jgi:uncharacterized protein YerC